MKKITRRDFIRSAAVSAISLATVSLSGCGSTASSSSGAAGTYKAGTYSATVRGFSSYVTVNMTFSNSAITNCSVDAAGETPEIGAKAAKELASLFVDKQTVDAVGSATADITIPAVQKAAANCIAQAQGLAMALNENVASNGDWLGKAPEVGAVKISSTVDTDLLIVGAGNGGMMAAATAADAGIKFVLCEQNTVVCETRDWIGAVDTTAQKKAGVTIQKDRLLNELARYASYKCDMDVIKMWMRNSAEMVAYLESLGFTTELHPAPDSHVGGSNMEYYVPSLWHTLNLPKGAPDDNRNAWLEQYIAKKGYKVTNGMTLVRLLQEKSGKVTGAIFSNVAGEYVQVNAENVILATGGYAGNPAMVKALSPMVNECVTANSYFGPDMGMGIRTGIWAGAKMDTEPAPMIFDRGLVAPGVKAGYIDDGKGNLQLPGTIGQFLLGTQPMLKVNKEGNRFANESCPYDFFNHAASMQTDGVYAAIFDANITEDVIAYDQYGCARLIVDMAQSGALMPYIQQYIDSGLVFKADTLEELADKLKIPAESLTATVAHYNKLCGKGVDEDYGKEGYRMKAVDSAPYYGCFFGGSLLTTCDGLRINHKCQVYNTEHKVIDGLYCIGDCSGSFFSGNYPEYFVGVAVGRTMTQGRYAVKAILGEKV